MKDELTEFLTRPLDSRQKKYQAISCRFLEASNAKLLPPGTPFPSQRSSMKLFHTSSNIILLVWRELKDVHKLIVTHDGKTFVSSGRRNTRQSGELQTAGSDRDPPIVLNKLAISAEPKKRNGHFFESVTELGERFDVPVSKINRQILPELINPLRNMINADLQMSFGKCEIFYAPQRYFALFSIFKALLSGDRIAVIAKPVEYLVTQAIDTSGRDSRLINAKYFGLDIIELENTLQQHETGIVYLASRAPFAGKGIISAEKMDRLILLQQKYKFVIMIDDRFPDKTDSDRRDIFNKISRLEDFIYLRPLTDLSGMYHELTVIAAPKKIMPKIKKRFEGLDPIVHPEISIVLADLMKNGKLKQYERRAKKEIKVRFWQMLNEFKKSGLFNNDELLKADNWFINLVPAKGSFQRNVYSQLALHDIEVFAPADYNLGADFIGAIPISVFDYETDEEFDIMMKRLLRILETLII